MTGNAGGSPYSDGGLLAALGPKAYPTPTRRVPAVRRGRFECSRNCGLLFP
jgi:hypothetical protein